MLLIETMLLKAETAEEAAGDLLYIWGRQQDGRLGYDLPGNPFLKVTAAYQNASFGIDTQNKLWSWGRNQIGILGLGSYTSVSRPTQVGNSSWTMIRGGRSHVIALRADGTLWTWGGNRFGSAGLNDSNQYSQRNSPVQIGTSSWISVAAGGYSSAAIRTDYTLWTWGRNNQGQLGLGDLGLQSSPVQVGTSAWTQVIIHSTASAIRQDGRLFSWGNNQYGTLGVLGTVRSWSMLATAQTPNAAAGIDSTGKLYTWGTNSYGILGQNNANNATFPTQVGTSNWTTVSVGQSHMVAIRQDNTLWSWGGGGFGQLGLGNQASNSSPAQVGTSLWTAVAAGTRHTAAIRSGGTLFAWGYNGFGQVGNDNITLQVSPNQLGTSSWTVVTAALTHTAAIRSGGTLFTWGGNDYGQLGGNLSQFQSWTAVSNGRSHTMAIRSDGTLWAWGFNAQGQLGLGNLTSARSAIQVGTSSWTAVVAGTTHTIAIRSDGRLFGWGSNTSSLSGVLTEAPRSWTALATAPIASHFAAIDSGGRLWTWGPNGSGQLGLGNTTTTSFPQQVGSSSWTAVTCGTANIHAIRQGGTLFGWGLNNSGQIGNNTLTNASSPVQIGSSSWTAVADGAGHTLAIRSGGTLFAWGSNTYGALGDGATANQSSPMQIGSSSWTAVAGGNLASLALRSGATLWSWGRNNTGILGQNDLTNRSSPVQIGTSVWSVISMGSSHAAAIRQGGTLFTWGQNNVGQLGDNTLVNRSSPVQIGTSSWTAVSATGGSTGNGNTWAIRSGATLFGWGSNSVDQVGDNTTISRSSPVQIGTSSWSLVSGRAYSGGATLQNSLLYVWGWNSFLQLGLADQFGGGGPRSPVLVGENSLSVSSPVQIGSSSWTAVTTGSRISAAIRSGGTLFTWGYQGSTGFLGNPDAAPLTNTLVRSPVQIGSSSWTAVSTAGSTMALRSGGTLWSWGTNGFGQLGHNDAIARSSPVQVGTSVWTSISAGYRTFAAIRQDGRLFAWGYNNRGQVGVEFSTANRSSPTQIGSSSWTVVSMSNSMSVAVRSGGTLFAWGYNRRGNLGLGTSSFGNNWSPIQVGSSSWTLVNVANNDIFNTFVRVGGITQGGTLYQWGYQPVGDNTILPRSSPVTVGGNPLNASSPVQIGTSSWTFVTAGYQQTMALRSGGTLWSWGRNYQGSLGLNNLLNQNSPVQVGTSTWTTVRVGRAAVAVRSDGSLFTWGNQFVGGALGTIASSPVQVGSRTDWNSAATSPDNTFFKGTDNLFYFIGPSNAVTLQAATNSPALLGEVYGSTSSPVQVGTSSWTLVTRGGTTAAAIRQDGRLFVWGTNSEGSLGLDSADLTLVVRSPTQLGTSSWTLVNQGDGAATVFTNMTTMAIRQGGNLFGWGPNAQGQIGDGLTKARSSPIQIGTGTWNDVWGSGGGFSFRYTLGIDGSQQLFGWGYNFYGQLGTGVSGGTSTVPTAAATAPEGASSPTQLGTYSWRQISINQTHAAAIRSDYKLFAWGRNNRGQVGDGTEINRSSPVQIGSSSWNMVSAGRSHTMGIRSDGILFGWGYNFNGQLGIAPWDIEANTRSPVQIGTSSWTQVQAAWRYTWALRSDNTLWTMGQNNYGAMGIQPVDTEIRYSSPVQLGTSSWSQVSARWNTSLAIRNDNTLWFLGGQDNFGQSGQNAGETQGRSSPIQIGTSSWSVAAAGIDQAMGAIRSDGALFTWGYGSYGSLGLNASGIFRSSPVQVGTSSWTALSVGGTNMLAVRSGGTLFSWGRGVSGGGVGDNAEINRSSPVQIGSSSWTAVSSANGWGAAL